MTPVNFEVRQRFDAPAKALWDEMIDWNGHADWVPMTRVEIDPGDPTAIGATFTAWTGPRPFALKDTMRVSVLEWDSASKSGRCEVTKLGPVLRGRAGFTVTAVGEGSELSWIEDVTVPVVPRFLAPIVTRLSAAGFRHGMKRLAKKLNQRSEANVR